MKNKISIIGLGAGGMEQLSVGVYRKLKQTEHLFLRTKEHPVIKDFEEEGITYHSFDYLYEQHDQFEEVYDAIVSKLLEEANTKDIVYAVPGHPLVAEKTVQLLLNYRNTNRDFEIVVEGGQSFIDPLFAALEIDPIEGFQFVDALSFQADELQLTEHMILCQVYDQMIASDVKLTLMERLPDDYEVTIVTAVGSNEEIIRKVPLYELDRGVEVNNLTSVYIPPVGSESPLLYHDFKTFKRVISRLRGPDGCPWDKEQTHESLKRYLIEEAYELLEAIDDKDDNHIVEELGDVLLQVVLHAQIGEDDGYFSMSDVIQSITEKMIRRHPHVFSNVSVESSDEVVKNWDEIKKQEKTGEGRPKSLLDSVPKSLPGIMKAYDYQKKAAKVGFDWKDVEPMWAKVEEEMNEFKEEICKNKDNTKKLLNEYGDILFALVNVARYYKINPEEAITMTNNKFYNRFHFIESEVDKQQLRMEQLPLEELDSIWEKAKKQGL